MRDSKEGSETAEVGEEDLEPNKSGKGGRSLLRGMLEAESSSISKKYSISFDLNTEAMVLTVDLGEALARWESEFTDTPEEWGATRDPDGIGCLFGGGTLEGSGGGGGVGPSLSSRDSNLSVESAKSRT